MEKWKNITGYNNYYVSTEGRVKSKNDKGNWGNERILKIIERKSGYCVVNLYSYSDGNKKMKQCRVHKLVAKAFIPNPKNKPLINHIDGDKTNNSVNNLEWVTHSENMNHSYKNGFHNQPSGQKTTKLTPKEVKEIRNRYKKEDISQYNLSIEYNVCESTIRNVVNRNSWKWV